MVFKKKSFKQAGCIKLPHGRQYWTQLWMKGKNCSNPSSLIHYLLITRCGKRHLPLPPHLWSVQNSASLNMNSHALFFSFSFPSLPFPSPFCMHDMFTARTSVWMHVRLTSLSPNLSEMESLINIIYASLAGLWEFSYLCFPSGRGSARITGACRGVQL